MASDYDIKAVFDELRKVARVVLGHRREMARRPSGNPERETNLRTSHLLGAQINLQSRGLRLKYVSLSALYRRMERDLIDLADAEGTSSYRSKYQETLSRHRRAIAALIDASAGQRGRRPDAGGGNRDIRPEFGREGRGEGSPLRRRGMVSRIRALR